MKALLVRRERVREVRDGLISMGIEFYEERDNFHFLFIFPELKESTGLNGKVCYLVSEEIGEVSTSGSTFKIEGPRDAINLFAPLFEKRGLKARMENPENLIEIKKWGTKYLISVA
ncbi:MAG: hypothetical protein M0Z77_00800 [Thermoplasmatales archaeon]|nr:hypothetical protein [Candidatus Thermoplasmatota archaeon]MCL6003053.1 hypothetical protein [Candidatus Thermoplasmatota archaeon]MDA8054172.1 hypothetical protein [Thermoplasmatales archaeon]